MMKMSEGSHRDCTDEPTIKAVYIATSPAIGWDLKDWIKMDLSKPSSGDSFIPTTHNITITPDELSQETIAALLYIHQNTKTTYMPYPNNKDNE